MVDVAFILSQIACVIGSFLLIYLRKKYNSVSNCLSVLNDELESQTENYNRLISENQVLKQQAQELEWIKELSNDLDKIEEYIKAKIEPRIVKHEYLCSECKIVDVRDNTIDNGIKTLNPHDYYAQIMQSPINDPRMMQNIHTGLMGAGAAQAMGLNSVYYR